MQVTKADYELELRQAEREIDTVTAKYKDLRDAYEKATGCDWEIE